MSSSKNPTSQATMLAVELDVQGAESTQQKDTVDKAEAVVRQEVSAEDMERLKYIAGWRFHVLTVGLWISLFLSTIESTIVSTALVSITDALDGFDQRDWIVTSYLLTYTGFLVIFAKLSDIYGRKTMLLLALAIFTIFSTGCGFATLMLELIILRTFQGIGASGIYSLIMAMAPNLVPREKYAKYVGIMSSVFAISSVLGPILGGVITSHATWRWVFLLNTPGGVIATILVAVSLSSTKTPETSFTAHISTKFSKAAFRRVDYIGMALLLIGSIVLVFALGPSAITYSWTTASISGLVIGCFCLMTFASWEYQLAKRSSVKEPVFPLRLLNSRILIGMMLTAFFLGFPFVVAVVNIPQRGQAVADLSAEKAGLALLPLLLISPVGTLASGLLSTTWRVPPAILIVLGAALQFLGVGLITSLPTNTKVISSQQYGYEVIMGLGFGLGLATVLNMAPLVVEEKDLAVTMGALTQVRVLGGTIGLAIGATILNNYFKSTLGGVLTSSQLTEISISLLSIDTLTTEQQVIVRQAFAEGYNRQMQYMLIFSGLALMTSFLCLEKKPRRVL